jgi:hypothetical protein
MKKVYVPLALALALAVPIVDAARRDDDGGALPFDVSELALARDTAALAGLERDGGYRSLVVGAAVPGAKSSQCKAQVFDRSGRVLDEEAFGVKAGSSAQFDFAGRMGSRVAVAAQVSCNQAFYPYAAAAATKEPKLTWAEAVGPTGACDFNVEATEITPGVFLAGQEGTIHNARTEKAKGIVCIKVPKDLKVGKLVLEWDVSVGPWHKKSPHGNHSMIWLHRGRFRSGTISNVNAFGPKKSIVKMIQNVDLPKLKNTNQKAGLALATNETYHLRYTYDAGSRDVTTEVFLRGELVRSMNMKGTNVGRAIFVPVFGFTTKGALFAEFGHFAGQHFPEMPSFGWRYSNLRVEMNVIN